MALAANAQAPSPDVLKQAAGEMVEVRRTYTVKNVSKQDIYLWVIQWDYENPPGTPLNRHSFSSRSSTLAPVLRTGETKSYSELLAKRKHPVVRPTVDVVLLADGTFFGKNESNSLDAFQNRLVTSYDLRKRILARLESDGT